jgi:DNA ligase 1
MSRFAAGKNGKQKVQFCIFDIMYLEGKRVTHLPLLERKKLLESVVEPTETFALVQWMI